jgi:hypothetical protein
MGHDLGLSAFPDHREKSGSGLDLSGVLPLIDPARLRQDRLFTSALGLAQSLLLSLGTGHLEVVTHQVILHMKCADRSHQQPALKSLSDIGKPSELG